MVVDDDPLVLANTVAMLEDLGHTAHSARSGTEAVELLKVERVDILITDQAMPGMSGSELAAIVRRQWPAMPVLIVTGYAELASKPDEAHVLNKPFTQTELAFGLEEITSAKVVQFNVANGRGKARGADAN